MMSEERRKTAEERSKGIRQPQFYSRSRTVRTFCHVMLLVENILSASVTSCRLPRPAPPPAPPGWAFKYPSKPCTMLPPMCESPRYEPSRL